MSAVQLNTDTPSTPVPPKASPRRRMIGYAALAACAVGYAGFVAVIVALKLSWISTATAIWAGGIFAVVGEVGLWVGAAYLGLSLYTRRKAMLARWFRRSKTEPSA
jgi:hypothetical protein